MNHWSERDCKLICQYNSMQRDNHCTDHSVWCSASSIISCLLVFFVVNSIEFLLAFAATH